MGDKVVMCSAIFTFVNYLLMGCRMLIYQNKIALPKQPLHVQVKRQHIQDGRSAALSTRAINNQPFVLSSLMDHKMIVRTIALTCTVRPLIVAHRYFTVGLSAMLRFGLVCVVLLFLPTSMYIGKKHLRHTLWREFKSWW